MWTCTSCSVKFTPTSGSRYCDSCRKIPMTKEEALENSRTKAKEWYYANKVRKQEYDKLRREEKPEVYREAAKRFRQSRPERKNADTSVRRKRVQGSTPKWASKRAIKDIYIEASQKTKETGQVWHVDHIYPLRGRLVCGLHVESNLQIIPAEDNLAKSNHYSLEHEGRK